MTPKTSFPLRTKKFAAHLLFYITVCFLFMLPDIIYGMIHPKFNAWFAQPEKLIAVFLFPIFLSFIRNPKFIFAALFLFGACHITQLSSMSYFGNPLTPFAIEFMFLESREVWLEGSAMFFKFLYLPFCVILPYLACFFLITRNKKRFTPKYGWVFLIIFFGYFIGRTYTPDGFHSMFFKSSSSPTYNTFSSYTAYFGNVLPRGIFQTKKENPFTPYHVEKTDVPSNINVIVLFGEGVNRNHMSLFGYIRDTTPHMIARAHKNQNFIFKPALSGAVNTLIALPMFLNVQREPKNFYKQVVKDTYLPKMAQENGFNTFFVSMQGRGVYEKSMVSNFKDVLLYEIDKNVGKPEFSEEASFKDALGKINLASGKNFVFFHLRNPHAPYFENYAFAKEKYEIYPTENVNKDEFRINTYDNAMIYEDVIITNLLDYLNTLSTPTYVYYISDHGESLGTNQHWGHGYLSPEVCETPFVFEGLHTMDKKYVQKIRDMIMPTNYEVGLLVAEKLGYTITNPNNTDDTYFINGPSSVGEAGMLRVQKDPATNSCKINPVRE